MKMRRFVKKLESLCIVLYCLLAFYSSIMYTGYSSYIYLAIVISPNYIAFVTLLYVLIIYCFCHLYFDPEPILLKHGHWCFKFNHVPGL